MVEFNDDVFGGDVVVEHSVDEVTEVFGEFGDFTVKAFGFGVLG